VYILEKPIKNGVRKILLPIKFSCQEFLRSILPDIKRGGGWSGWEGIMKKNSVIL